MKWKLIIDELASQFRSTRRSFSRVFTRRERKGCVGCRGRGEERAFAAAARLVARRFPTRRGDDSSRVFIDLERLRLNLIRRIWGEIEERGMDRRAFHASRGYTAASFSVRSSTLGTEGIERIHACCGKETGREEGWKSVNERSSVLRRFCGERVKPGEIHRRCAYSSSPSDFFTSIHPRFATLLDRI